MKPRKIWIIGPFPPIKGGISQYDEYLANELKKSSELHCISYKRQYPKFLIKNREQIDVSYKERAQADFSIDSVNPLTWLTVLNKVRKFKPDLVILPWWVVYWAPMYLFFLSSFRLLNIKSLLICHNIYEHEDNALKKALSKSVLKMAGTFLVHTESEKIKLKNIVGAKTIIKHLLPIFSSVSIDYSKSQKIGSEQFDLELLFFGFVRPYKGLDMLLEALQYVENAKVHLTIAGEFWDDKEDYLNYIKEHNLQNIDIVDEYISDEEVADYFRCCDVVVLPYRDATGSAVIASAYGHNRPVLVTNVGGLPDAVASGRTGYISEPDPKAIGAGITWFIEHKDTAFDKEIESFVKNRMSWESLAKQIYKHLEPRDAS